MFKLLLVILFATGIYANDYQYQPNGCVNGTLFYEDNEIYSQTETCNQIGSSNFYRIKTTESITASKEWQTRDHALFTKYSDSLCQAQTTWERYRLDDADYSTIWGKVKAKCEFINGKQYFYFEDTIGQKFGVTETKACTNGGLRPGDYIITCIKNINVVVTTSSSSTGASLTTPPSESSSTLIRFSALTLILCWFLLH